jgi:hypothetical protein
VTTCIAVIGAAPAVGKTTVVHGIVDWLRGQGRKVDLVEEDELLTRTEFAPVARELAATAHVHPQTLLDAATAVLDSNAGDDGTVIVWDDLLPFIGVLLGWRYDGSAIAEFLDDLGARLTGVRVAVLYLDADVHEALRLAADREPPHYMDWHVETLKRRDIGPVVQDLDSAADYLDWERSLTLRLLEEHGWEVLYLGGAERLTPEHMVMNATDALTPLL